MSFLLLVEQTAPETPSTNQVVVYPKSDGRVYSKDDAGTERAISASAVATTDNAVARYDGTAGALQNSGVIISDTNALTGIASISGLTTDLAIAEGGTAASTAADARTNFGLVAGGAGDIWAEKAGDTFTGDVMIEKNLPALRLKQVAEATSYLDIIRDSSGQFFYDSAQVTFGGHAFRTDSGAGLTNRFSISNAGNATFAGTLAASNLSGTNTGDEPAASDTVAGEIEIAVQSEMETGTDNTRAVVPGRQHFHPGHPKAWVKFNSAGTIAASYNIASVTDNGVGNWTVNIATDFSTADYCGVAFGGAIVTTEAPLIYNIAIAAAAGTFNIKAKNVSDTLTDPGNANEIYALFSGDQA